MREDGTPGLPILPPLTQETPEEKREHHKPNCFNLRRSDGTWAVFAARADACRDPA